MSQTDMPSKDKVNPFGQLLGLEFSEMEGGHSHCRLQVRNDHLNPYGYVHGGVMYSLADTAMGGAMYSCIASDERCATVEMKVSYLRGLTSGVLECEAHVLHRSRRLGYLEAEVKCDDQLIAKASATFSIFKHQGSD